MLETIITLVFIVPIIAACVVFALCAEWMAMQENQSAEKHGLA